MAAPSDAASHDPGDDVSDDQPSQAAEVSLAAAGGGGSRRHTLRTPPPLHPHHQEHHYHHPHHHHAHSPLQAPDLPSPMSLYQLGIPPLSPLSLRRQPSFSPRDGEHEHEHGGADGDDESREGDDGDEDRDGDESHGWPDEDDDRDLTQDSRDVLVDRLNDLAKRLSAGAPRGDSVSALHAKVDEMEKVLAGRGAPARRRRPPGAGGEASAGDPDRLGLPPPSWFVPQLYGHDSTRPSLPPGPREGAAAAEPRIASEAAERIVREAEKLCAEMAEVVKSMQDRREESDHLHGLFIEREERAAQRIIELERHAAELEDEVQESESELRFLRLQLRAIEVQCLEYMPPGADPELVQSIQNWKSDWANLHRRWAARRGGLHEGDASFVTASSAGAR